MNLVNYLGKQVLGIVSGYQKEEVIVSVCAVFINEDNSLRLYFPKGHCFTHDDLITLHLDNRSGVDQYDADIKVYRASYKGRVAKIDNDWAEIIPRECQLFYGLKIVLEIKEEGYSYPIDMRADVPIEKSHLERMPTSERKDYLNKVGVLVTMAEEQPHTTVLAFLSSINDDVFLITFSNTFKSKLLKKNPHCFFAIDERANYTFENAIDWNFTIMEGDAYVIEPGSNLYESVRNEFIIKNPWEMGFFLKDGLEMYHIKTKQIICAESKGRKVKV